MAEQTAAPDVESAHTSRHVTDEIEPFAIRRDGGVGIAAGGILRDGELAGFRPGGIASFRHHDGGIAWMGRVGLTLGEIHRPTIRRQTAGTLVKVGVQFRVDALGFAPSALVVLLREEDVCGLGTCDPAPVVALCLVTGGGEVEQVIVVTAYHG